MEVAKPGNGYNLSSQAPAEPCSGMIPFSHPCDSLAHLGAASLVPVRMVARSKATRMPAEHKCPLTCAGNILFSIFAKSCSNRERLTIYAKNCTEHAALTCLCELAVLAKLLSAICQRKTRDGSSSTRVAPIVNQRAML
eukprot:3989007-Amphidinium_carterae.1